MATAGKQRRTYQEKIQTYLQEKFRDLSQQKIVEYAQTIESRAFDTCQSSEATYRAKLREGFEQIVRHLQADRNIPTQATRVATKTPYEVTEKRPSEEHLQFQKQVKVYGEQIKRAILRMKKCNETPEIKKTIQQGESMIDFFRRQLERRETLRPEKWSQLRKDCEKLIARATALVAGPPEIIMPRAKERSFSELVNERNDRRALLVSKLKQKIEEKQPFNTDKLQDMLKKYYEGPKEWIKNHLKNAEMAKKTNSTASDTSSGYDTFSSSLPGDFAFEPERKTGGATGVTNNPVVKQEMRQPESDPWRNPDFSERPKPSNGNADLVSNPNTMSKNAHVNPRAAYMRHNGPSPGYTEGGRTREAPKNVPIDRRPQKYMKVEPDFDDFTIKTQRPVAGGRPGNGVSSSMGQPGHSRQTNMSSGDRYGHSRTSEQAYNSQMTKNVGHTRNPNPDVNANFMDGFFGDSDIPSSRMGAGGSSQMNERNSANAPSFDQGLDDNNAPYDRREDFDAFDSGDLFSSNPRRPIQAKRQYPMEPGRGGDQRGGSSHLESRMDLRVPSRGRGGIDRDFSHEPFDSETAPTRDSRDPGMRERVGGARRPGGRVDSRDTADNHRDHRMMNSMRPSRPEPMNMRDHGRYDSRYQGHDDLDYQEPMENKSRGGMHHRDGPRREYSDYDQMRYQESQRPVQRNPVASRRPAYNNMYDNEDIPAGDDGYGYGGRGGNGGGNNPSSSSGIPRERGPMGGGGGQSSGSSAQVENDINRVVAHLKDKGFALQLLNENSSSRTYMICLSNYPHWGSLNIMVSTESLYEMPRLLHCDRKKDVENRLVEEIRRSEGSGRQANRFYLAVKSWFEIQKKLHQKQENPYQIGTGVKRIECNEEGQETHIQMAKDCAEERVHLFVYPPLSVSANSQPISWS